MKRPYEYEAEGLEAQVRQHVATLSIPDTLIQRSDRDLMRLLARERSGKNTQAERQRIEQAIERLAELYADGEITREAYDRKKREYLAQMPDDIEGANEPVMVLLTLASARDSVQEAGLAVFREMATALYDRIVLREGGLLDYQAREWCAEWMGRK